MTSRRPVYTKLGCGLKSRRLGFSILRGLAANVAQPPKLDNELYVRGYACCMLCYKGVEACGVDAQNTFVIAVAGRGFDARMSTEFSVPLPDSACVYGGRGCGDLTAHS
jgi:predicted molibdopterin-dependent oxidoreductase YjgC